MTCLLKNSSLWTRFEQPSFSSESSLFWHLFAWANSVFWVYKFTSVSFSFGVRLNWLMDYFFCRHHVGFNVLKISPLWLAPCSVLLKTYCERVYIYCNDLHSCLKVSCLFNCCDGGSNIKTVQTKGNDRYILDEMHASLLYKVTSHVKFMW